MSTLTVWIGGTGVVTTVWWRGHPDPNLPDAATIAAFYAIAVGGALLGLCRWPS